MDSLRDKKVLFSQSSLESQPTNTVHDPHSWPRVKKLYVAFVICLYTLIVYAGSTLCLAMYPTFLSRYNVSLTVASLAMALYVAGYGMGAMIFSPLSEVPSIGRNPPYLITFALFVLISSALALIDNWPGFLVLRFLQGFVGSPALATGGASLQDMYHVPEMPFAFIAWIGAATLGPAFGPSVSIWLVTSHGYHWPMWLLFWLSLPCLIIMFFTLPETSLAKLQYVADGPVTNKSPSSLREKASSFAAASFDVAWKPLRIMLTNPAILFANFYTCLIYAVYYSFFESFPRIYIEEYGFTFEEFGLTFLSITVGTVLGISIYLPYAVWWRRNGGSSTTAERCLAPAILGSILTSVGLFVFAMTAKPRLHWSIGLIGVVIETIGVFLVLQCLANYLILAYPKDAASLLAGNDFMRSSLAAGAIVFSQPLYENLGAERGVFILAGTTIACVVGMVLLFLFGHRAR